MSENKHTPEPWFSQYDDNGFYEIGSESVSLRLAFTYGEGDTDEANARRIVACVNACAGLETEMLEALVMDGTTLQNIMRRGLICLEQRDDLLKALEDIAWTRGLNERPSKLVEQLERKALIAIAKIKEAA